MRPFIQVSVGVLDVKLHVFVPELYAAVLEITDAVHVPETTSQ